MLERLEPEVWKKANDTLLHPMHNTPTHALEGLEHSGERGTEGDDASRSVGHKSKRSMCRDRREGIALPAGHLSLRYIYCT